MNQPRSVQPWGTDGDKRRYFLIEGQDDTAFRVYRESNPQGTNRTWWSVAGSIEELRALADKMETKDGGPKATKFAQKIANALTRFEAGEEVNLHPYLISPRTTLTKRSVAETQATGISTDAERAIQAPRAWLLYV